MEQTKLNVKNMHCKSCENLINEALEEKGIKSQADSNKGIVKVTFDENKITLDEIKKIIKKEEFEVN